MIGILINHFFAIFKVSRPETFESETRKNGSRDRDQVSRLTTDFYFAPPILQNDKCGYRSIRNYGDCSSCVKCDQFS